MWVDFGVFSLMQFYIMIPYYIMLMIDRPIDALMRIEWVEFVFLCRNGSKPLKLWICDLIVFWWNWLRGFVPHNLRIIMYVIALHLSENWLRLSSKSFSGTELVREARPCLMNGQAVLDELRPKTHYLFFKHGRAWCTTRPCFMQEVEDSPKQGRAYFMLGHASSR